MNSTHENQALSSKDQGFLTGEQSVIHETKGIVIPHTSLLLRTSWRWLAGEYSNTETGNSYPRELMNTSQPLPDLGQPCVLLRARSCTRAT